MALRLKGRGARGTLRAFLFFSSVFEQECYGPLKKECYDKVQGYIAKSRMLLNYNIYIYVLFNLYINDTIFI